MVRLLELVFDDDLRTGFILADDIDREVAGRLLAPGVRERDVETVVQDIDVFFQPAREVQRLVFERLAKRDAGDLLDHVVSLPPMSPRRSSGCSWRRYRLFTSALPSERDGNAQRQERRFLIVSILDDHRALFVSYKTYAE